jgi:hypothetical protein
VKGMFAGTGMAVDPIDLSIKEARRRFPVLQSVPIVNRPNIDNIGGGLLEAYPAEESIRPKGTDNKFAIGVFSEKTTPEDIYMDYLSHYAMDNELKKDYEQFKQNLTPKNKKRLQRQWADLTRGYATDSKGNITERFGEPMRKRDGSKVPFKEWKERSGIPGMFRGLLGQYPQEFIESEFTPEQIEYGQKLKDMLGL